jgi:hypothetical protein
MTQIKWSTMGNVLHSSDTCGLTNVAAVFVNREDACRAAAALNAMEEVREMADNIRSQLKEQR